MTKQNKEIIASLLAGAVLFILLCVTIVGADYAIVNWSRHSFNSNHADSVLTQTGTYRHVWDIISSDTVKQSYRADSVKWGGVYKTLAAILPDSFALFLRLHGQADSAALADSAVGAARLGGSTPDFPVSLMAESLAVKAKMDNKGRGLFSADSTYTVYGIRIDTGYPLKMGAAATSPTMNDTMGTRFIMHGALMADTVIIGGESGAHLAVSGNMLFNASGGFYSSSTIQIVGDGGFRLYDDNGGIYNDKVNVLGLGADDTTGAAKVNAAGILSDSATVLMPWAKGTRPATPSTGMLIMVDGDTTNDSLLVYLGGAWVVIKP